MSNLENKNQSMTASAVAEIILWLQEHAPNAQLHSDSRAIQLGDVFFAFPITGSKGDGRAFIQNAIERGAAVIVYEKEGAAISHDTSIPHLAVSGLIDLLGEIANQWYGNPDQDMFCVAVTGTNGKTSCSQWIAKALSMQGAPAAVIGTLGVGNYRDGMMSQLQETGFTTPDALQLQARLAHLKKNGAKSLAIEASSIGIHQGRLNALHFDIALFTNLTRDHLDYHGTMEAYAAAKAALFDWAGLRAGVINADDAFGVELLQQLSSNKPELKLLAYSIDGASEIAMPSLRASQLKTTSIGTQFHVESPFGSGVVKTQMIGRFNVSNVLGVLGVLLMKGIAWERAVATIEKLTSVQGRMQQLGSQGQAMVVVDYAHTPDALEKTLQALQPIAQERQGSLWCVFGCGGDRDPGKRPQMGKIAQIAQHVVVTSDNPRTEDPEKILQDILAGMQGTPNAIVDRASAILYAVKHAHANDVILIAGKGHENYQEIHGKKWPFSDEEHALLALATVATNSTMRRSS
ncbi:UDP-N-acetylmuramoyl-L-alanyl-D-glutamate--2,6-diaminopimelate ligase [Undibacterium macrobrachii]|jgi:UDP-N-acetylmuramoyl-L-alanyl-D-glutamate--2,6-diaminopimelate ligase|uniref:UDP-N-acetylmuramoyl-L-alanyl-D-glutamate--2,6-diaminopimelate ligase n=1 Tax=Undibacterium macrobrachii TaxID=1119058 RepID=A0ABQ2XF38_9BURK|nr:UDP-N-acetylmuramoyl-L-alanyl-D-glutamate--2,6-diaminopimelate ligase [Undibacterium macrobrachii]GGX14352.1 UDP-N-acetylmuramoyl-L-alanyl-D-glutamate--2,6-diaminopimelate ligase [Undibacterium macrobrachii]